MAFDPRRKMSIHYHRVFKFFLFMCCFVTPNVVGSSSSITDRHEIMCKNNSRQRHISFGVLIDEKTRMGKEQRVAMELAAHDLRRHNYHCLNLKHSSSRNLARAASAAIDLVMLFKVDAIIGKITQEEASILSGLEAVNRTIPVVSLYPTSTSNQISQTSPFFIEMGTPMNYQVQCMAAIIGHFKWKKVVLLHEQGDSYSEDFNLVSHFSDSLKVVNSSIAHHLVFPRLSLLLNPKKFAEEQLMTLKRENARIFVVTQFSLEFASILFETVKEFKMMEKGYAWIVTDEVVNFLDSVDLSVKYSMQGVIGLKTYSSHNSDTLREFRSRFRKIYGSKYPQEENSNPSVYASHAYDATIMMAKALLLDSKEEINSRMPKISASRSQNPMFQIINVIGTGYTEVALWSSNSGFSQNVVEENNGKTDGLSKKLSLITWPGGDHTFPKGLSVGSKERPLKIGVPAKGAFPWFVKVTYDPKQNRTNIIGFSIAVFEASVNQLPYDLHYVLVPYNGSYDEMVLEVSKQNLDAAVGDTQIMANRSAYVEFTQPYVGSGLVMVVTAKPGLELSRWFPFNIFTKKVWIQLVTLNILTGAIVWFSEHAIGNETFTKKSLFGHVVSVLWLSITMLSLSQREDIQSSTSKFVMGTWTRIIFVVGACFNAILSTVMTVPLLQPSIPDLNYIRNTNSPVGCNGNSFICEYLVDALHLKQENIRGFNSINEYPEAFQNGSIKAAFFVEPHAKVFFAQNCKGYAKTEQNFILGGFGFVFPKGSSLAFDFSEAILKIMQSGQADNIQKSMLSSNCSSSTVLELVLDSKAFDFMFEVMVYVSVIACLVAIFSFVKTHYASMVLLTEVYRRLDMRVIFRERIVVRNRANVVQLAVLPRN